MNRQDQHRQQKEKERDDEKKQRKIYEEEHASQRWPFHPAWFVVVGVLLTLLVVYVWTAGLW